MQPNLNKKNNCLIGVISDTHGMLRPEALDALKGVDMILHAGDVGQYQIIETLESIAPVVPVRGNMDGGGRTGELPPWETVTAGGADIFILHDEYMLDMEPAAAGFAVVVCGHTHQPVVRKKNGVLFLNPGSAGPRRKDYPVSVALLTIADGIPDARIVILAP